MPLKRNEDWQGDSSFCIKRVAAVSVIASLVTFSVIMAYFAFFY
jgi:hypothetical protein